MKRVLAILGIVGFIVLGATMAAAQQSAQPVVRLGNWIEVGNELFMHILGSIDANYRTTQNYDFESRIRDRTNSRRVNDSANNEGSSDSHWAEVRIGAEWRYQKSLTAQVLFEQQNTFDAGVVDSRDNQNSPGGIAIFNDGARSAAQREDNGFHVERYWINYKFLGTPLSMEIGSRSWRLDQAAMVSDDDPRFAVFADFGNFDLQAAAVIERESQRIGLTNDNDSVYYTFSAGYTFKPHRVQFDVVYSRDRYTGADVLAVAGGGGGAEGFRGQKTDAVNISASWKGKVGPLNGIVQGMVSTGTARGGTGVGLAANERNIDYDILGFAAIARLELDLGMVKPWAGVLFASGDGDPTDTKLQGFHHRAMRRSGSGTTSDIFRTLEVSPAAGGHRDYWCPAGMTGARARAGGIGNDVFDGVDQCGHTIDNWANDRIGGPSHTGIEIVYSNPGALVLPVGVDLTPIKGHDISVFYLYKQFVSTVLLEAAYDLPRGSIDKAQVHEIGARWQWTLNPHFDIRLSGSAGFAAAGYKDLARLADCNPSPAVVQACEGDDVALQGHARFRARF